MKAARNNIDIGELAALLYLVAPLFIFFAAYVRYSIAIPACTLIAIQVVDLLRHTNRERIFTLRREILFYGCVAFLWVWLSGGMGRVNQNSDWLKHYSIVNFLVEHPGLSADQFGKVDNAVLRYSLGWYLVPSMALKAMVGKAQSLVLSAWSILGVWLCFSLLPAITGTGRRALLLAPLIFILFGGADFLGTLITGYQHGPKYHLEWWAGWIEYSSSNTSLFWVPQHAIPAWLGAALFMRQRERPTLLPYLSLIMASVLFWSPFSFIGLLPFFTALAFTHGLRATAFGWRSLLSFLLLVVPVGTYLVARSVEIPSGFIWTVPCVWKDGPCFSWSSYVLFLFIEIGLATCVLLLLREDEQGFLFAAVAALCAIPLFRIGLNNDFGMRASLPSLAVIAILCAKQVFRYSRPYVLAFFLVLVLAMPTTVGEIYRGFLPHPAVPVDTTFHDPWAERYIEQYFVPGPLWIFR